MANKILEDPNQGPQIATGEKNPTMAGFRIASLFRNADPRELWSTLNLLQLKRVKVLTAL